MTDRKPASTDSTEPPEHRFRLHRAVLAHDYALVRRLVENEKVNIDQRDWHGNPPLHLAIHFHDVEMVRLLVSLGADCTNRNGGRWSALNEARAGGNGNTLREVYTGLHASMRRKYLRKLPKILRAIEGLKDCYLELRWEFKSWIPLVSRLAPSDTYKVWKYGSSFRVDTTLVGFQNMTWKRGNVSFLFLGNESDHPGAVVVVDHESKKVEFAVDAIKPYDPSKMDEELKELSVASISRAFTMVDKVEFTQRKGWFGGAVEEEHNGYKCKVYDFDGLEFHSSERLVKGASKSEKHTVRPMTQPDPLPDYYWQRPTDEPEGRGYGFLYPNEEITDNVRQIKGSVYLSDEFPYDMRDLIPIFEVLAPTGQHFETLVKFFTAKLPSDGFPVRLDIPVVPLVSATVSFLTYQDSGLDADEMKERVTLPKDYNLSKIDLWEFDEKEIAAATESLEGLEHQQDGEHAEDKSLL
jgi:hypothetical protein